MYLTEPLGGLMFGGAELTWRNWAQEDVDTGSFRV